MYLRLMRHGHAYHIDDLDVQATLVDIGLARFSGLLPGADAVCDEPLAYLALDCWVRCEDNRTAQYHQYAKNNRTNWTSNNGFVNFVAIYLAHVFSTWQSLDKIFVLGTNEVWEREGLTNKRARLVSHYRDYRGDEVAPISFPFDRPASGCSTVLGVNAESPQEVIDWLQSRAPSRAPFCFPTNTIGPDILFSLEVEESYGQADDRYSLHDARLLVAVKVRDSPNDFSGEEFQDAIRSITPAFFYKKVRIFAFGTWPHQLNLRLCTGAQREWSPHLGRDCVRTRAPSS